MPLIRNTSSQGPVNIYSGFVTVNDFTMTENGHVGVAFFLSGLSTSTSAIYTILVEVWNASSAQIEYFTDTVNKHNTTAAGQRIQLDRTFFLPDDFRIKVSVKSSSSSDTGASIIGYLFDPNCASDLIGLGGQPFSGFVGANFDNLFNNDDTIGGTALDDLSQFDAATTPVKISVGSGTGQLGISGGRVEANVVYWNGAAVATPDAAGHPKVTVKNGTGAGELSLTAGAVVAGSLGVTAKGEVNAEVLDVVNVDTPIDGKTIIAALKIIAAVVAGKVSGAGTGTETFKGLDGTTERVEVEVNAEGDRTTVTYS